MIGVYENMARSRLSALSERNNYEKGCGNNGLGQRFAGRFGSD